MNFGRLLLFELTLEIETKIYFEPNRWAETAGRPVWNLAAACWRESALGWAGSVPGRLSGADRAGELGRTATHKAEATRLRWAVRTSCARQCVVPTTFGAAPTQRGFAGGSEARRRRRYVEAQLQEEAAVQLRQPAHPGSSATLYPVEADNSRRSAAGTLLGELRRSAKMRRKGWNQAWSKTERERREVAHRLEHATAELAEEERHGKDGVEAMLWTTRRRSLPAEGKRAAARDGATQSGRGDAAR
jgi:hypothetical protein